MLVATGWKETGLAFLMMKGWWNLLIFSLMWRLSMDGSLQLRKDKQNEISLVRHWDTNGDSNDLILSFHHGDFHHHVFCEENNLQCFYAFMLHLSDWMRTKFLLPKSMTSNIWKEENICSSTAIQNDLSQGVLRSYGKFLSYIWVQLIVSYVKKFD